MAKRKKLITIDVWIAVVILASIIISLLNVDIQEEIPSMSLEGFEKVDVRMESNDMIFSSKCRSLSMTITNTQALSISYGLKNKTYVRPLTHEVIRNSFENFGIKVPFVKIDVYEKGIYKAKIFMKKENQILEMDARPSDAVGVAVKMSAPIYFSSNLLEKFGTYNC